MHPQIKIWIDNTGLHSVGRCLEKKGNGPIDVKGLLQLASEIIFSDNILISAFESDGVKLRTESIHSQLLDLGLTPEVLTIQPFAMETYAEVCKTAAEKFSKDIEYINFDVENVDKTLLKATKPDFIPKEKRREDSVHRLITQSWSKQQLKDIARTSLEIKAAGATSYMLIKCESLWEQVCRLAKSKTWSENMTAQLITALRYYLNDQLAKDKHSLYAPAVARAEVYRKNAESISNRLSSIAVEAAQKLKPKSIGTPSVAGALIERSIGDPKGVIIEALYFRSLAKDLRNYLAKRFDTINFGTFEWNYEVDTELREIAETLEKELYPKKRPKWRDAIELHLGILPLSIKMKAFSEWLEFEKKRKYIAVLTEMSKKIAYSESEHLLLNTLVRKSCET